MVKSLSLIHISGNLDSKSGGEVMELLQNVWKKMGKALVVITHDRSLIHIYFVCNQYDENIPVSYGSDRLDLYFWGNPFNGAADTSERDFSYFTPVSYTHLDVYKSQSHYYLSMSPFQLAAVSPLPVRLAAGA